MTVFSNVADTIAKFYSFSIEPSLYKFRRTKRLQELGLDLNSAMFTINVALGDCKSLSCLQLQQRYAEYFRHFVHSDGNASLLKKSGRIAAVIDLHAIKNHQEFIDLLKKRSGNFYRIAKKAQNTGYQTQQFSSKNYAPDILEIHQSLKIRSFGIVLDAFLLNIDDFGGVPLELNPIEVPECNQHWQLFFGVFIPEEGHRQGVIVANKKLVAYAHLERIGNIARYASYMGHGNHMHNGVMMLLHINIIEWLQDINNPLAQGVQFLIYGGIEQGSHGLFFWKRKALFEARLLCS